MTLKQPFVTRTTGSSWLWVRGIAVGGCTGIVKAAPRGAEHGLGTISLRILSRRGVRPLRLFHENGCTFLVLYDSICCLIERVDKYSLVIWTEYEKNKDLSREWGYQKC